MIRFALFLAAISVLYIGGFVYDEVGPLLYAVILTIIASTPLLFKFSFWKKLLFMVPLIVLRVIGKVFLSVFGKNALSKLLARYGLLEQRFNQTLKAVDSAKNRGIARWMRMSRASQAYLLLIFLPVGIVIFILSLIIKFVRFKFLQFVVEKTMQTYLMRWTVDSKSAKQNERVVGDQDAIRDKDAAQEDKPSLQSSRISEHKTKQTLGGGLRQNPERAPERDEGRKRR